jgi:hypothetical protein
MIDYLRLIIWMKYNYLMPEDYSANKQGVQVPLYDQPGQMQMSLHVALLAQFIAVVDQF